MLIALNEFSWWWNRWVPGNKSSEQKDTEATENTVKEKEPIEKLAVIYDENSKYGYHPFKNPYYDFNEKLFDYDKTLTELKKVSTKNNKKLFTV